MTYRLFIGLSPPDPVRDALASRREGLPGARWREADSLHLTLHFLGDVDRRMFEEIASALSDVRAPGFALEWTEIGVFGSEGRPRAVWAGVRANNGLTLLHGRVGAAIRKAGVEPEKRKFTPHVTLAYLRGAHDADVAKYAGEQDLIDVPDWPVGEFHLYSSHLGGDHSVYRLEESYFLERP